RSSACSSFSRHSASEHEGRRMNFKTSILPIIAAAALTWTVSSAAAQDVTATVRTWSGQSLQLVQPSLEVFYTIVSKTQETSAAAGGSSARQASASARVGVAK